MFVVTDGLVEKRAVILGRRIPGYVGIREGVVAGESVVTEGTSKVRPGSQVESVDQAAATNTQPATEG